MWTIEKHIKYAVWTQNWYGLERTDALTARTQMSEVVVVQKKPVLSPLRHYTNSSRDQRGHVLLIKRVGTRRSKRPRLQRGWLTYGRVKEDEQILLQTQKVAHGRREGR